MTKPYILTEKKACLKTLMSHSSFMAESMYTWGCLTILFRLFLPHFTLARKTPRWKTSSQKREKGIVKGGRKCKGRDKEEKKREKRKGKKEERKVRGTKGEGSKRHGKPELKPQ